MKEHTVDTMESTEETEVGIAPANAEVNMAPGTTYVLNIDASGFLLVKFCNTPHKALNGRQEILPVPLVYLTGDQYFAQFIEPPYIKKRLETLRSLIKNRSPVPQMLTYECEVLTYSGMIIFIIIYFIRIFCTNLIAF